MKSAIGASLPLIGVTGRWYHAATRGYPGRILRVTPSGSPSASGYEPTRFNPGNAHGGSPSFETLYLALDSETALFEKRVQFGDPYDILSSVLVSSKIKKTAVLPVDVNLDGIVDLSDVRTHGLLDTSAQELTGDWLGYEKRGLGLAPPLGVLSAPIGPAPTQHLAWELFQDPRIKGVISFSAKVPTTCCLVVFTHKMQPPDSLSWDDPNKGQREHYPK